MSQTRRLLVMLLLLGTACSISGYETDHGEWRYPRYCEEGYCEYKATWEYVPIKDSIRFTVQAKVSPGYWAGIGFSRDGRMPGADCVTGFRSKYGKDFHLQDRYLIQRNKFSVPADDQQDARLGYHSYSDGWLKFSFIRKRDTWDPYDLTLTECRFYLFAWGGEATGPHGIDTHKHEFSSEEKICVGPLIKYYPDVPSLSAGGKYTKNSGYYTIPDGCTGDYCVYKAEWEYDYASDSVEFKIEANVGRGYWAGLGISENRMMHSSDAIVGFVSKSGGDFRLVDRFLIMKRPDRVPKDASQDAKILYYAHSNNRLKFTFVRKRYTKDRYDLPLTVCRHLLFAWGGKAFSDDDIRQHKYAFASKKKICIGPVDDDSHTDGDYVYNGPGYGGNDHRPPSYGVGQQGDHGWSVGQQGDHGWQ